MNNNTYTWSVKAVTEDYTSEDGTLFPDTVKEVYWLLEAVDNATGAKVQIEGREVLPPPTDPETFIDLSVLLDKTEEERRGTVLGWAEMIAPGFVDNYENKAAKMLEVRNKALGGQSPGPQVVEVV